MSKQDVNLEIEDDALMMTASREWELPRVAESTGIDARWVQAFLSLRIADLLAQVSTGQKLAVLDAKDRAWLKGQADALVQDAVDRFDDDLVEGDEEYQPHHEPEYDFDGLTESEKVQ